MPFPELRKPLRESVPEYLSPPCPQVFPQGKSSPLSVNIIHAKVQQYLSRDDFNGKTINESTCTLPTQ